MAGFEELQGWAGPRWADNAWEAIGAEFPHFFIAGQEAATQGKTFRAWDVWRKLFNGNDMVRVTQETGDCFPAGTMVLMADGSQKPIQDVNAGDVVVSHLNKSCRVLRRIEKPYTGDLVTVGVRNIQTKLTATLDHRIVRVIRGQPDQWMPIGLAKIGDSILVPFGVKNTSEYEPISANQFNSSWSESIVVSGCISSVDAKRGGLKRAKYQIPEVIKCDERLGRLIGIFLAEGSNEGHRLRFSFASSERDTLAAETRALLKSIFGLDSTERLVHKNKSCLVVTCGSGALSKFFKSLVEGNVYSKSVPDIIQRSPHSVRMACIRGWMDGDGHLLKEGSLTGVSASQPLLQSLSRLCISCGLLPSVMTRKKASHQRVAAGTLSLSRHFSAYLYPNIDRKKHWRPLKSFSGFGVKIRTIERNVMVDGVVYCLEVDTDHSFVANGFAVHNCVGDSTTDVINATQAIEIVRGDREKWRQTLISYVYAYSRVIVGKNQLRGGAGSVGSWMAKAVQEGGVLPVDDPNVPKYSGKLSDTWGDDKKYNGISFRDFIDSANDRTIKTVARVTTWSELRDAVINGHLGTIASNRGYRMKPDSSGFHRPSGSWSHQMSILGLCDDPKQSWVAIGNQWGDQHGRLTDFETGEPWPVGMLRVTREDFESKHLTRDAECFVYSNFDGFPDQSEDLEGLLI